MIIGKIRADREAVIELEIVGSNHNEKVEVVIDTGFTGFLMLPIDLINRPYTTHGIRTTHAICSIGHGQHFP